MAAWIGAGSGGSVSPNEMDAAIDRMIVSAKRDLEPQSKKERQARRRQCERSVFARLDHGAGRPCVFLPFLGEIGWLIMWHMRLVHFSKAARKIVCCHRGQECLFPTADEFFYDWQDPVDDTERAGTDRIERKWPEIQDRFPGVAPIAAGGLTMDEELIPVHPEQRIPLKPRITRGLKVDVCIGVRNRGFLPDKNYPHWPRVAAELAARGLTFAVIGSQASSYPLDGMACMSGDYGDWDAAIELLQNCRLFVGTDSGGAHLASVANSCPMIVQQVPDPASGTTRCFIPRMKLTTDHQVIRLGQDQWDWPEVLIEHALRMLK